VSPQFQGSLDAPEGVQGIGGIGRSVQRHLSSCVRERRSSTIIGTDGETVKRRDWLIATLTAFFVLQAPLCVLACLLDGDSKDGVAEHRAVSCHDPGRGPSSHLPSNSSPDSSRSPSPGPARSEPIGAHDNCGCGDTLSAVVPGATWTAWNSTSSAAIVPSSLAYATEVAASWRRPIPPGQTDLPPPDILLLKSSFLI
jgi:hypothetical protein